MITLDQRAVMFRCAAAANKTQEMKKFYNETADQLDAIGKAYNDLYAAAESFVDDGDGTKLREHFARVRAEARKHKERSGAG